MNSLYDVISSCCYGNALFDHRFSCRTPDGRHIHFFVQVKHSELTTKQGRLMTDKVLDWYQKCTKALSQVGTFVIVLISNKELFEDVNKGITLSYTDLITLCKFLLLITHTEFEAFFGPFSSRGFYHI
eukprot:TRINITY_DN8283_c0_g1_i3.p1 TRINITY_DN8283_c0_g1~~TRINITY_DN8283_c0_g1_i3.p1  ORF type:complete len:128 (-),score=4.48 TRINITY_DN8283_c0_g1_i3:92-475(-)